MSSPAWGDIVNAWRSLARTPGLTALAMFSLAVAIGPNSALFSIVDRVLLSSSLDRAPQSLVGIRARTDQGASGLSYPEYRDLRAYSRLLDPVVASYRTGGVLMTAGNKEVVAAELVSSGYLQLLGVRAQVGRLLASREDEAEGGSVPAVISHALWQRRFAGSRDAVGKTFYLAGVAVTCVGVLEPDFRGVDLLSHVGLWLPLESWMNAQPGMREILQKRDAWNMEVMALPKPGVQLPTIRDELRAISQRLAQEHPSSVRNRSWVAWAARDDDKSKRRASSLIVLCLAAVVLLVACTNVCVLLLARAESRARETAIRIALGASQWRLFRSFLSEGLLLCLGASALAFLFAHWLLRLASALQPVTLLPINFDFAIDARVILYTLLLAVGISLLFALAPVWQARPRSLAGSMNQRSSTSVSVRRGGRFASLVVMQVAVSQALLLGAALLVRSYQENRMVRPGFDVDKNLVMMTLIPSPDAGTRRATRYHDLADLVRALPGVRRASFIGNVPLSGSGDRVIRFKASGGSDPAAAIRVPLSNVGLGYFETIGTRVLHGRAFEGGDLQTRRVVVVNQRFTRRLFPELASPAEAIGRSVAADEGVLRIVGVAEDGKYSGLREAPQPHVFVLTPESTFEETTLLLEILGRPEEAVPSISSTIQASAPQLWIAGISTMKQHMRAARVLDEVGAFLTASMGLLSLLLTAVGLAGLSTYWVQRRMPEIGVRLAVGATPPQVVRFLQAQAMRPVVTGMCLGILFGLGIGRILSGLLFGIHPYDPMALVCGVLFPLAVGYAATRIPSQRGASVDPICVLRQE